MTRTLITVAAALALTASACKKNETKDEGKPAGEAASEAASEPARPPGEAQKQPPDAKPDPLAHVPDDPKANYAVARISHAEPRPGDPVHVVFNKVDIARLSIKDTADLTGSTAEIHIALGELDSGVPDRDAHLKSPEFFDAASNPIATVTISGVTRAGDKKYNATARVEAMGVTRTWPVSFEVIASDGDSVRVKGTHKFKRSDFKIGEGQQGPADDVELELNLTLDKS